MNKKIFYLHIPKTGGTSLNNDISKLCPGIRKFTHVEGIIRDPNNNHSLDTYRFISGHLFLNEALSFFPPDKWLYICLIRDPIQQLESHINWVLKITEDQSSDFFRNHGPIFQNMSFEIRGMDLEEPEGIRKLVTKILDNDLYRNLFDNCQTRYLTRRSKAPVTYNDLYSAIDSIHKHFKLIGPIELYQDYLKELSHLLHVPLSGHSSRQNINQQKINLFDTEEKMGLIKPFLQYDQQLYNMILLKIQELFKRHP